MNANTSVRTALSAALLLAIAPVYAADPAPAAVTMTGEFTPKLYYFDYFKGFGEERTQFLEQYDYQKGFSGDRRSDFYLDADISFLIASPERNLFVLERVGYGAYNHRGFARADSDKFGFAANYSFYRSATSGVDYLYSPNQVVGGTDTSYCPVFALPSTCSNTNSGYVAVFNDDSNQFLYTIDRTTYGAGFNLKPAMFGDVVTASFNYDGYTRDGNQITQYVLGGGDTVPAPLARWRGFSQPVDENMNRFSFKVAATPGEQFQAVYDFTYETFSNKARQFVFGDIPLQAPFTLAGDPTRPLGFVPDSTLIRQGLSLSKNFGMVAVAAGYGHSSLEQDTFTAPQTVAGYTEGKITTDNAYLKISGNVSPSVGLDGFVTYYNRDNESSFPVATFIETVAAERLGVRINSIETWKYGLSATFRTGVLRSTITPGWEHVDTDRDLTFHQASLVPAVSGIAPPRSLYREQTKSDELYVKIIARPAQGVTVRLTPYYLWADETGLVTEPEEAFGLKAKASYAMPTGATLSGYYNYLKATNGNNVFNSNVANSLASSGTVTQDLEANLQSAGLVFNLPVSEWINTFASLSWVQNDYETYYFSTNRRRFEAPAQPVTFVTRERPNYNVDTYVFSIGGDWQVSDPLRVNGTYIFSHSKGDAASGQTLIELPAVDGRIDNVVHTLALGFDYDLKKALKLKGSWTYDYYDDDVYSALTGGVNTLMLGLSLGF